MGLRPVDVRRGLPLAVGVGMRRGADGGVPALFGLEEECLGPKAAERRRLYFALGRAAARDALADLGVPPVAIGCGAGGEPLWPPGFVGAISHTGDLAVAIVGDATDYAGLGVDIEQLSPGLSARAARMVCTPAELAWTDDDDATASSGPRRASDRGPRRALDSGPVRTLDSATRRTMVFSAKEAVFKALFPIERVWLGFSDAELTWRPDLGAFDARLLKRASRVHHRDAVLSVNCTLTDAEILSTTYALAAPVEPAPIGSGGCMVGPP